MAEKKERERERSGGGKEMAVRSRSIGSYDADLNWYRYVSSVSHNAQQRLKKMYTLDVPVIV